MTITPYELALYCGALFVLFLTPGTVWAALIARGLSGGFHAAWPLALGVVIGDVIWPLLAILGVSWIVGVYAGFMTALRVIAVIFFVAIGILAIRNADRTAQADTRLTRPGMWAGFAAGVAVILSNPKAILFYMGVLPGFFDISVLTWVDIVLICAASFLVPLIGNLALIAFIHRARRLLSSPQALRKTNIATGYLLILVGIAIGLT